MDSVQGCKQEIDMTDKLKKEISSIMDRAAMGNATVCILNRFANTA
ncbi:hypothetical protein [Providencia sp. PROV254]|nr:hypothetical protein [Providencia sp. PROV254]